MGTSSARLICFAALILTTVGPPCLFAQQTNAQTTPAISGSQSGTEATSSTSTAPPPQSAPDALELYRNHKYAEAAQVTRNEIAANPQHLDSYVVLGWSLLALGQYQSALDTATEAIGFAGNDSRLLEIAGESDYRLGKYGEALKYFQTYVANATSSNNRLIDDVYYFMGEIYMSLGQYNRADTSITTAVHFNPGDAQYWDRLGHARELAKEYTRAADAYRQALSLSPSSSDAADGLKRVQALAGQ